MIFIPIYLWAKCANHPAAVTQPARRQYRFRVRQRRHRHYRSFARQMKRHDGLRATTAVTRTKVKRTTAPVMSGQRREQLAFLWSIRPVVQQGRILPLPPCRSPYCPCPCLQTSLPRRRSGRLVKVWVTVLGCAWKRDQCTIAHLSVPSLSWFGSFFFRIIVLLYFLSCSSGGHHFHSAVTELATTGTVVIECMHFDARLQRDLPTYHIGSQWKGQTVIWAEQLEVRWEKT
jgi:hypothetical protein